MARGKRNPSEVFANVMASAKAQLLADASVAEAFKHSGIRGDERAGKLMELLKQKLPQRFAVTKGEAIDCHDHRTGQLDIVIYDTQTCPPLMAGTENDLIPAEAIYAVIEVKSLLNQDELDSCYKHAKKLRELRPFKKCRFISARSDGAAATDGNPRCLYLVFSYKTNLGSNDWIEKEFDRLGKSSKSQKSKMDYIDRLIVLSQGIIIPGEARGKTEESDKESIFLDFYLHLINFLSREVTRRPVIDWQNYGLRSSPGWIKLG